MKKKIAIVHDWLIDFGGAESCLASIIKCFPDADLFTVVDHFDKQQRKKIFNKESKTTFIQNLPFSKKLYRKYLPFMPFAVEQFDLSKYDVVISSSHAVAKGVLTGPDQTHICYCHSPIRYAWDLQHQYLDESNLKMGPLGLIARVLLSKIRIWDARTSNGVDKFIANSNFISRRIKKIYRRKSEVIYPPVDTSSFTALAPSEGDYYVTCSRLVPYKRIDLIVKTFKEELKDKNLTVIGDGPEMKKILNISGKSKNINILGFQKHKDMVNTISNSKAFIFAAEEDFGIAPVEAQALGIPVIAFKKGGALETIVGHDEVNPTGVFFDEQNEKSLKGAILFYEKNSEKFSRKKCIINAQKFDKKIFENKIKYLVESLCKP